MMKNKLTYYLLSINFILLGGLLGLENLEILTLGLGKCFWGVLLICCAISIAIGNVKGKGEKSIFLPVFAFFAGVIVILLQLTKLTFASLWPLILTAIFSAVTLSSLLREKDEFLTEIGVCGFCVSIAFLVASLFDLWDIIIPFVLILLGIAIIVLTTIKHKKKYEIPTISIEERAEKLKEKEVQK